RGWEWHYVRRLCHLDLVTCRGNTKDAWALAFSPDGTRVACGTNGGVRTIPGCGGALGGVGSYIVKGGELAVWDAATGQEVFAHRDLKEGIRSLAFSPDGRRIITGAITGGGLTLWDATTGRELWKRTDPVSMVVEVGFSPDGQWIAAG